jgi:hypothetical protein
MTVRVASSIEVKALPEAVWAVLCSAQMPVTAPCEFRFGSFSPPTPLRCELPEGRGGIGSRRRCVTDRGIVEQRIVEWTEGERLAFELVADTAGLNTHVRSMRDVFVLKQALGPDGPTTLTRFTDFEPQGPCEQLRGFALSLAVRRVHRFTLRGFKAAVEAT